MWPKTGPQCPAKNDRPWIMRRGVGVLRRQSLRVLVPAEADLAADGWPRSGRRRRCRSTPTFALAGRPRLRDRARVGTHRQRELEDRDRRLVVRRGSPARGAVRRRAWAAAGTPGSGPARARPIRAGAALAPRRLAVMSAPPARCYRPGGARLRGRMRRRERYGAQVGSRSSKSSAPDRAVASRAASGAGSSPRPPRRRRLEARAT